MSRKQLTAKQHAFLQFLAEHVRRKKVWPTYREIVEHFGYRSPNSVTQNLRALTKKGYLERDHKGYRIIGQRSGLSGGFPVQGMLENGAYEVSLSVDEVTLKDLFPELDRTFAVRVADGAARGLELGAGDYVLLTDEEVGAGEMAAVVHEGTLAVCRVFREGGSFRLQHDDGSEESVEANTEALLLLGRYAGHINRAGLFRKLPVSPSRRESPLKLADATA